MNHIVVKSRVSRDGVVRVDVPVGREQANREVQVTVEPLPSATITQEE